MFDFKACFAALNHDKAPFPWQERLFHQAMDGQWPKLLSLPTASGKTAIIDIALLILAAGSPAARRRIAFVVDRRVVVDEAARKAEHIAERLEKALLNSSDVLFPVAQTLCAIGDSDKPLVVSTLRGGIQPDDSWARSPAQPAILLSTVDQVGSRLLFRAYGGSSPRSWPIHAGLLGVDCLLVIDEAHCSQPFCETVQLIADKYCNWSEVPLARPLNMIRMSATPGELADFELETDDYNNDELRKRITASKPARLELVGANDENHRSQLIETIIERASRLLTTPRVIGIVVNRVADARVIFENLPLPEDRKLLLTGRARGWERDRLIEKWLPRLRAGNRTHVGEALAVVATQCIEVGANLDFDALISEIASMDALRQRFGRLNRLGDREDAEAIILATAAQTKINKDNKADNPDAIYGDSIAQTWQWMTTKHATPKKTGGAKRKKGDASTIDFGTINFRIDSLSEMLAEAEALSSLCTPERHAPVLLPAHLDILIQTSPLPAQSPDASVFLHGYQSGPAEVTVVWRADLFEDSPETWVDVVAVQPPTTGEGCPVPFYAARSWLSQTPAKDEGGDVEGTDLGDDRLSTQGEMLRALRWRGADDTEVIEYLDLRPGDTIVVPSTYGGCDTFGWNWDSSSAVVDIGDAVAHAAGKRPLLRLDTRVLHPWLNGSSDMPAFVNLRLWAEGEDIEGTDKIDPGDELEVLATNVSLPIWLRQLAERLRKDTSLNSMMVSGLPVLLGRKRSRWEGSTAEDGSELTVQVGLTSHSKGVRDWVARFALSIGLDDRLCRTFTQAAWFHDVGKADPRFQVYLHGGDELEAAMSDEVLAKSGLNIRSRMARRRARNRSKYPNGYRHEVMSLALIQNLKGLASSEYERDLMLHLVSSHHGLCRPFAPAILDAEPVDVMVNHGDLALAARSDHSMHVLDSGIAERFWRLVRRYGWWGIAWLEACFRLADHRRSEQEEMEGGDNDE